MTTNYKTWYQSASIRSEMQDDTLVPEKLIERFDVHMYLEICNIDVCSVPMASDSNVQVIAISDNGVCGSSVHTSRMNFRKYVCKATCHR
jgi:hypothetical protein